MDENPAEIFIVFLQTVIEFLYIRLSEESENTLFKLPRSLSGNNLNQGYLFSYSFVNDPVELSFDFKSLIKYVVEVEYQFGHDRDYYTSRSTPTLPSPSRERMIN